MAWSLCLALSACSGCESDPAREPPANPGACNDEPQPPTARPEPVLSPAFRGATTLGLAGAADITNRTGENPTTSTWDGKVVVRRCPDPSWPADDFAEPPVDGQPGVVKGQYWCFHAFRPMRVTVGADGAPDFSQAFGPGFMSTTRHVSHTGGFPIVENSSPDARWNPYRSTADGVACGVASIEPVPPPCPPERYATYDVHIVHSVGPTNPTMLTDYPDWPGGEGSPTYFERMRIVVQDHESETARVVAVLRDSTPYPMIADPNGFGFVYDPSDETIRNPYLARKPGSSDPTTYIGGIVTIEPAATNDGRMVLFNGGDENPNGINLIYTWNPNPAAQSGWSPPKNVAYMYYVEGPGSPNGETTIAIDGVEYAFSDVFPIARRPLVDQEGRPYNPGFDYLPAVRNPDPEGYPYLFDAAIAEQQYLGSYPWISWDGRNIMSLSVGRYNVAVIGDLTNYGMYWIDGAIDRTDFRGNEGHEISAMWNFGQWPGRWAQYGVEFEGRARTVPTRLTDAPTWAIFEQDHYSEISFHKTDGSYALYFPMSRLRDRTTVYRDGYTPDVSGNFHTGVLVPADGQVDFSQSFSEAGYAKDALSRSFGFSGNSVGFLTDAAASTVGPHIVADPIDGIEGALTVEGAVYLQTGESLPAGPWATIVRQPGVFGLGIDENQHAWFEIVDAEGAVTRLVGDAPLGSDRWIHLAGVHDAGEMRLYVDARPVAAQANAASALQTSTESVVVGPKSDGAQPGGHGLVFIDEVGVSLLVRTLEEIAHSAFQRIEWPVASLAQWESIWGAGAMPLGMADASGALLAPLHLGFEVGGDLEAKVQLGERLFHEDALSTTNPPIACESCHTLTQEHAGARRGEVVSTQGAGELTRHTPTVYNRVFGRRQFWDGRAPDLAEQLLFPITSPVEMNMALDSLLDTVLPAAGYGADFCAAYGSEEPTRDRLQEAMALYESGLVAGNSAVDRHRFLNEPLSESAERGLALFATKARCIGCHPPPLYGDERFHDNAQGNEMDPGRAFFTAREGDFGRFRTMSLRDVARTPPYMHDGSIATLQEAMDRYNSGGDDDGEIAMRPLHLRPDEILDLVEFLRALDSQQRVVPLR